MPYPLGHCCPTGRFWLFRPYFISYPNLVLPYRTFIVHASLKISYLGCAVLLMFCFFFGGGGGGWVCWGISDSPAPVSNTFFVKQSLIVMSSAHILCCPRLALAAIPRWTVSESAGCPLTRHWVKMLKLTSQARIRRRHGVSRGWGRCCLAHQVVRTHRARRKWFHGRTVPRSCMTHVPWQEMARTF